MAQVTAFVLGPGLRERRRAHSDQWRSPASIPSISRKVETSIIYSASSYFSRAFSSSSGFNRAAIVSRTNGATMVALTDFHAAKLGAPVQNVASLIPCRRHNSAALSPASVVGKQRRTAKRKRIVRP